MYLKPEKYIYLRTEKVVGGKRLSIRSHSDVVAER